MRRAIAGTLTCMLAGDEEVANYYHHVCILKYIK